MLPWQQAEIK